MLPDPRPYFTGLADPRRETTNKLHRLEDIVMIVLCAVLSGVEDWVGMEVFAQEKEAWLRGFLHLPNGIPSHDTLSGVMGRLNPQAFAGAFTRWVEEGLPRLAGGQVALDGKTLWGSRDSTGAVHLVSAFAAQARWVVAQTAVADKSNEITAIPELLELLDLSGAVVTVDAMGCQKAVARQIVEPEADYVLALKDNHPSLHEDVRLWLDTEEAQGRLAVEETVEKGHGRLERRRYTLSNELDWLVQKPEWRGLKAVGMAEASCEVQGKISVERRYFLCSFNELPRFAQTVRTHWCIENQAHWVLDVQFGEDANRSRADHSAENLALMRRAAMNLLRQGKGSQSLRQRKLRAAFSDSYRERLLSGASTT